MCPDTLLHGHTPPPSHTHPAGPGPCRMPGRPMSDELVCVATDRQTDRRTVDVVRLIVATFAAPDRAPADDDVITLSRSRDTQRTSATLRQRVNNNNNNKQICIAPCCQAASRLPVSQG